MKYVKVLVVILLASVALTACATDTLNDEV